MKSVGTLQLYIDYKLTLNGLNSPKISHFYRIKPKARLVPNYGMETNFFAIYIAIF